MKLSDTIRTFLQQPHMARVSTIDPDGYPHTVPVWYMLDGDDIVIATGASTRKIKNILANPKGAVTIGGEPIGKHRAYEPCYLIQGEFVLEPDPENAWIRRIAHHYRDDDQIEHDIAEWGPHDAIRLTIRKVIQVMP
jgi:nitroimidazol reductase NimA-like FMN-containing flavoprotein (pyridoxamine 5'-phosphate oxidase superfamily)